MAPSIFWLQGPRVETMLAKTVGSRDPKIFTLDDFSFQGVVGRALDLRKPVLLWGRSNAGKTEYAEAHFEHPLVVRRRDDMKRLTPKHDGDRPPPDRQ